MEQGLKVTTQLGFTHDYAHEFGGEPGIRIFRYYRVLINGMVSLRYHVEKEYSRDWYMIVGGNCRFLPDAKSRSEAHKIIKKDIDKIGVEWFVQQELEGGND